MKWLLLFSFFAFAEEKYPKHLLVEMEVMSCRGENAERLDVTARVAKEKVIYLYKLQQEGKWLTKAQIEPKPFVIYNIAKVSCDELLKRKFNIFERPQKSDACAKKPNSHWSCRHEAYNLLSYPPWLNDYK